MIVTALIKMMRNKVAFCSKAREHELSLYTNSDKLQIIFTHYLCQHYRYCNNIIFIIIAPIEQLLSIIIAIDIIITTDIITTTKIDITSNSDIFIHLTSSS